MAAGCAHGRGPLVVLEQRDGFRKCLVEDEHLGRTGFCQADKMKTELTRAIQWRKDPVVVRHSAVPTPGMSATVASRRGRFI